MGCNNDDLCLPSFLSHGLFVSPYFWYLLLITILAGFLIYWILYKQDSSNWFVKTFYNPTYPGGNAFIWIYLVIYILLFVSVIASVASNKNCKCISIGYTIILILTIAWVAAIKERMFNWSYTLLAFLILLAFWLIWITNPYRDGNYFTFIISILYLASLFVGIYYNYSLANHDCNYKHHNDSSSEN